MGSRRRSDPALMAQLREDNVPLEVCISSNVCTGAVESLEAHPVRTLYEAGVPIDDPYGRSGVFPYYADAGV